MNSKEVQKQIDIIDRVTAEALKSPETSRKILENAGILMKEIKLSHLTFVDIKIIMGHAKKERKNNEYASLDCPEEPTEEFVYWRSVYDICYNELTSRIEQIFHKDEK